MRFSSRLSGALATLLLAGVALGQSGRSVSVQGTPFVGDKGITESVAQIMARQQLEPTLEPFNPLLALKEEMEVERDHLKNHPGSPISSQWPLPTNRLAPGGNLRGGGPLLPQPIGVSFLAIQSSESGFIPPDTQGAVGLTQILCAANGRIKVFDKTGVLGGLNVTTNTFFSSVRNASTVSDPRVRFDKHTNRWIVAAINVSRPNRILIAVSSGPTITSSASFTFFQFTQDAVGGGASDTGRLADYPTLGVDEDALYVGTNMFSTTAYTGSTGFVIQKASVLGAGPIVVTAFRQLATGSVDGPYTPQGVDNWEPGTNEGYFAGVGSTSFGTIYIRRVTNPGGTPSISANLLVTVPATGDATTVATLGSTLPLDGIDDRLMMASFRKNKITGVQTLWTAHAFEVNASGTPSTTGNRAGTRWYEIGNLTSTPTLVQAGTVFDSAATNPKSYWMPGVNMSGQGHVVLGSTFAGLADRAGVSVAGRYRTDALGTMAAPTLAVTSSTNYNAQSAPNQSQRWGDYSAVYVDPNDDMTMWAVQEYCNAANSWGCRVVQLLAPPPATVSSLAPNNANQGQTLNVTVNGTSVGNSGWFYGGTGFNPITASVSGTGVTVNSVTFVNPAQITLNITVAAGATTGARNLTITNPDGQSLTANNVLTINSIGPVDAAPTSFSILTGSLLSGGLSDILTSDDLRLTIRPSFAGARTDPNIVVEATTTAANPATLSRIDIRVEALATAGPNTQSIEAFNYVSNTWVSLGSVATSTTDLAQTVSITTNPSNYRSGGQMKIRYVVKADVANGSRSWTGQIDQIKWTLTP